MITKVKYGLSASGAMSSSLTPKQLARLNRILQLVAAAYSDDPGTSDLDDEQPVSTVAGLDLGDVRLARRLTR